MQNLSYINSSKFLINGIKDDCFVCHIEIFQNLWEAQEDCKLSKGHYLKKKNTNLPYLEKKIVCFNIYYSFRKKIIVVFDL
jgi:hypothetical protein